MSNSCSILHFLLGTSFTYLLVGYLLPVRTGRTEGIFVLLYQVTTTVHSRGMLHHGHQEKGPYFFTRTERPSPDP